MLLSLKNFSGEQGEVHDYQYDKNDNSFTATIRAKTDQNEDLQFYSDWYSDWIGKFSKGTATNWIVRYTYPTAKKYLYRKVCKCHHNNFDKLKKRKREDTRQRGKYCNATIGILFKKVNRDTIRNDCLLNKGLNVVIQITFKHSHRIVVAEAYNYLRMSVDTETIFLKYSEDGMTASAARSFHEIYLESDNDESEISLVLANAQINPTERQVKYLYTKSRNANFGGREYPDMLNALKSKPDKYTEKGAKVIIQENPLIIVVLTPIMIRAHNHQFANEIVFVDSSGSCDQTNTCVTLIFGAMIFAENVINKNTTLNNPELHQKNTDDNHYTVEEKHFSNITEMDFNAEHSKAGTELSSNFDRLTDMASNGKTVDMISGLTKWNKILSKIDTPLQLINFIHSSKNFTSKKNISVQPTSVSRRKIRPGLTSGAKRIEAGRPSKHERKKNGQRKRSLAVNVDLNRPNAKSHGTGH